MSSVALHCAPHPDDELIGAPATLMALRDAGWRVVNLACRLGRPEQRLRREVELREACRLAGFELRLPKRLAASAGAWDASHARADLLEMVRDAIAELQPAIVVSPGPHELHPSHALLAGAVRDALAALGDRAPRWWMWALWGSLRQPTLATGFGPLRLEEILAALGAHRGELARNDYRGLVEGEAAPTAGRWRLGKLRWLDPASPLPPPGEIAALVE